MKTLLVLTLVALASVEAYGQSSGPLPVAPAPDVSSGSESCQDAKPSAFVTPTYPAQAMKAKQNGWVVVEFDVTAEGLPSKVNVIASSPAAIFDAAAVSAIRQWRFNAGSPRQKCRTEVRFDLKVNG